MQKKKNGHASYIVIAFTGLKNKLNIRIMWTLKIEYDYSFISRHFLVFVPSPSFII